MKLQWLERAIGAIAPRYALNRARHHLQLEQVRRYEGATNGRRTEGWFTPSTSANADIQVDLRKLRDRHRFLCQNNAWVARAKQAVVSHTISHGITSKLSKVNKTAQKRWKQWTNSTACDADGRLDWSGIQALVMGAVFESGECLIRRRWRTKADRLAVPMQLQVLEADYLDHSKTEMLAGGARIIQGVEFDAIGRRVAYWLFRDHPGDMIGRGGVAERVPARDVIHVYRVERPGQVRGVPWGHANIITVRDMDDCEDAFLFRQKIANCQVGVIYDENGAAETNNPALSEGFQPGRFDYLKPGQKITFNTPPPASDINPMLRHYLLRLAAAYGITYAALTGDLSRVNFSSGRMGHLDMGRNVTQWQWLMLVPQLLDPVIAWFGEAIELTGVSAEGITAEHGMPRREMIDPGKEIAAIVAMVRAGLMTLPAAHRELGEDSEQLLAEYAAANDTLDDLKLILDSDPRKTARAGAKTAAKRGARSTTRPPAKRAAAKPRSSTKKAA